MAFQKLLEQSVEEGRIDVEERAAVDADESLRQLVAHALRDQGTALDDGPDAAGERVNGFYSPLADLN